MKKLFLISAILFVAITSSFAFQPTHDTRVLVAVTGEGAKSQAVAINLNCEVYVWVSCATYGYAVVSGNGSTLYLSHSSAYGSETKSEYWINTWTTITLYAYAATGGPNDPVNANTAGIVW
jgi:hypothetical protein